MRRTLAPRQPPRLVRTYIRTYVRTHTTTRLDSFLSRRERYLSSLAALLVIAPIIVVPTSHRRRCIDADANFPFAERFECVTHTHTHSLSLYTLENRGGRRGGGRGRRRGRKIHERESERETKEEGAQGGVKDVCYARYDREKQRILSEAFGRMFIDVIFAPRSGEKRTSIGEICLICRALI